MKKLSYLAVVLSVVVLASLWPQTSGAVPIFARKYGFDCSMCHSSYPRLNDFGQRFRANGYQVPGRESVDKTVLASPAPIAMRTSAGYNNDSFTDQYADPDVRNFQVNGIDVFSAGLLQNNMGYFLVYTPEITGSRGVAPQEGALESANVIFSNIADTSLLNLRAGRFEPAAVAFSGKRRLLFSPYEIYDFGPSGGPVLSDNQEGVELTGYLHGFSYAAGYVNGSPSNDSDDGPTDYYGRMAVVLGAGEGQTAGQRFGVTGYFGQARPDPLTYGIDDLKPLSRVGFDASLNLMQLNLSAQYLMGEDDGDLWGKQHGVSFTGGFGELTWTPTPRIAAVARYDWVDASKRVDADLTRIGGGARFYFANNLALHLEYSQRCQEVTDAPDLYENFYTVRLDFAF